MSATEWGFGDLDIVPEYLNADGLNRIEDNTEILANALNGHTPSYHVLIKPRDEPWEISDIPRTTDIRRYNFFYTRPHAGTVFFLYI
jgi:hypothetical protein